MNFGDDSTIDCDSLTGLAGTYADDGSVTTQTLIEVLHAAGYPFDSRWLERQREVGLLQIAGIRSYGGWAEGRFGVYDCRAKDAVLAIARLRAQRIRSHDLPVRLALEGHWVSPAALLAALQAGTGLIRRILAANSARDESSAADRFVSVCERRPAVRLEWGLPERLAEVDSIARGLFYDVAAILAGTFEGSSTFVISMWRRMIRVTTDDEVTLTSIGAENLVEEFIKAARLLREGSEAVVHATEADAQRSLAALQWTIDVRDTAIAEGKRGYLFANLVGRALSIVSLDTQFGLFIAYTVVRMADESNLNTCFSPALARNSLNSVSPPLVADHNESSAVKSR